MDEDSYSSMPAQLVKGVFGAGIHIHTIFITKAERVLTQLSREFLRL